MLAFKSMQRMHFLEAFPFLQKSYFEKYSNNTYIKRIQTPQQILCQSSEMLAFKSMQRMHFLEAFPFLQKSYFEKYSNNTYIKHSTKGCLKYF